MPWSLYPLGNCPQYPLDSRLGGPQSQSICDGLEKICPSWESIPGNQVHWYIDLSLNWGQHSSIPVVDGVDYVLQSRTEEKLLAQWAFSKKKVFLHVATSPWLDNVIQPGQSASTQLNLDTWVNVLNIYFPWGHIVCFSGVGVTGQGDRESDGWHGGLTTRI
jgi:hypothetical protein